MTHPLADLVYDALFDLESEEDLETALIDWSQLTPLERSFASAHLRWLGNAQLAELTDAVRALTTLVEDLATRPSRPPDVIDAVEVDDG